MDYYTALRKPASLAAMLFMAALIAFMPALDAGYIWDDDVLLVSNPQMRDTHGLVEIWQGKNTRDYTPLTSTFFWLEFRLWGSGHSAGYHTINILLHGLAAVLLWRILALLQIPGPWLAALLFAIHPVNAASAAWVSELKNTLAFVLFLASILTFLLSYAFKNRPVYIASILLFLLAGLSKGAVVTLPVVLLGCILWLNKKITRRDLLQILPFAVISGGIAWLTIHYQFRAENYGLLPDSMQYRIARAGMAVGWYLQGIFFPLGLSPIAPQWALDLHSPATYVPAFAAVALFALFFARRKTWSRPFLFAYGYYLLMLLPILGFAWMTLQQETPAADWWQYMATPGIFAAVAATFTVAARQSSKLIRFGMQMSMMALATLLTFQSINRSLIYESMETYCSAVVAETPTAWTLQNNFGITLRQKGRPVEAISHYRQSLAANPRFVEARNNLANALSDTGNFHEAGQEFQQALLLRPFDPNLLSSLADAYAREGKLHEAIATSASIIKLEHTGAHDNALHYNQFGLLLAANKQFEQAILVFKNAIYLAPENIDIRINLIKALLNIGKPAEAKVACEEALPIALKTGTSLQVRALKDLLEESGKSTAVP